jgi:FtsP/CotA-like multicopper oxidase with cupredoxin domain
VQARYSDIRVPPKQSGLHDLKTLGPKLKLTMNGVPCPTQPPIRPGESFTYESARADAGAFWHHPQANGLRGAFVFQIDEGHFTRVDVNVIASVGRAVVFDGAINPQREIGSQEITRLQTVILFGRRRLRHQTKKDED